MRGALVTAAAGLLAAAALGATAPSASAAFPGRNGQLAVGGEIFNPDGSGRRPLVAGHSPNWSADGMRIAFVRDEGGIAVADADGSDVRVLSTDPEDEDPAWSPDGERIAFSHPAGAGELEGLQIFTMAADGSDRRELTMPDPETLVAGSRPDWSPDGATIVYVAQGRSCASGLEAVHPDGSAAPVPAPASAILSDNVEQPDWAPDGSGVALVLGNQCSHHDGSDVVGPDGATLASFDPGNCAPDNGCLWFVNQQPVVAPDGTQVAYWRLPISGGGTGGIRIIGIDGGGDHLVLPDAGFSPKLDWRPLPATPPAGACAAPGARRGGPGPDVLVGTPGDDVLCGGGGADLLIGRGGDDVLVGGPGADVLRGGAGIDRLFGEGGNDVLLGADGDDILVGGAGGDVLRGDAGADSLLSDGDARRDVVLCGDGPDLALTDADDVRRSCSP